MSNRPPKLTNFDLFVIALTMVSLVNIVWMVAPLSQQITNVVLIVDVVFSIAFLADFFLRLHRAPSKSTYFFQNRGWLDLLSSLPFPYIRILRIVRMMRLYRPIRTLGPGGIWKRLTIDLASSALLVALFLSIVVIQYASMGILWAESDNPDANIRTASDAVWWSYVTVTTVGYGDRFPVTNTGRMVGVALLTVGVGLLGVLSGFLANTFLKPKRTAPEISQPARLDLTLRELEALIERLRPAATSQSRTTNTRAVINGSPAREETVA